MLWVTRTRMGSRVDMPTELWKLPVPVTASLKKPAFVLLPGRQCEIFFHFEREDGTWRMFSILFITVEAFKCTYLTSCRPEMLAEAYGKLLNLGDTPWLSEVRGIHHLNARPSKQLQHLSVCLDRGPCYEFICADYVLSF